MSTLERISDATPDQREELLARLRAVAPEIFTDGQLDLDRLAELAGEEVAGGPERYGLNWPGKREAITMLQAPSNATLAPDRDASVNFDTAKHVFIEGENLEVLKLLYKSYFGRVKLIYIDPPYNTQNDFIYHDDFSDPLAAYLRQTGQMTEDGDLTTSAPEKAGRLHSNWLSMMYPRLSMARQMLREDGFIVVSIDDVEQPNLRLLMDDVFGEENFVAVLVYDRNRKNDAKLFSVGHEYMIVYSRNRSFLKEHDITLRATKEGVEEVRAEFERLRKIHCDDWALVRSELLKYYDKFEEEDPRAPLARYRKVDERGPYRDDGNINWPGGGGPRYEVLHPITNQPVKLPRSGWRYPTIARFNEEYKKGRIVFGIDEKTVPSIRYDLFESTEQVERSVIFSYAQTASQQFDDIFNGKKVFENPKSYADLERLVKYLSDDDDIVLDFFAGSNTTMHGVIRANNGISNRVSIAVQMPQPIVATEKPSAANNALALGFKTIADIARDRIRRVWSRASQGPAMGFRAFHLTKSSVRRWTGIENPTPESYLKQMDAFADTLLPGWKAEDVVWEVALREGFAVTATVETVGDAANKIWRVRDDEQDKAFTICLADHVELEAIKTLTLTKADLFVCRDTALNDTIAANLALQCTLKVL